MTTNANDNSKANTTSAADAMSAMMPDVEAVTERIRQLNEKMIEATKQGGNLSLDAYERTLSSLVDFEQKTADASQLDFVSALAQAHATFLSDVSSAFTNAARDTLK